MRTGPDGDNPLTIRYLLQPHVKSLGLGVLVIIGGSIADLMQPWPIKVIIDTVLKGQQARGWMGALLVSIAGNDQLAILRLAAVASLVIAGIGALCSFAEKSLTMTVGQKVLH